MTRQCTRCGATIPPEASACPRCLFALGMERPAPASEPEPSGTLPRRPRGRAPTLAELAPLFPQLLLLEPLGEGGMGVVYKARHRQLGRLVALKVLPREAADDPAFLERFAREARALAQLDHPNIVRVHDHGEAGGYPYLTMEFVDGENLRQRLRSGALAPRDALALVPQICDALQYAHDEGVVHRDIKPENILVTRDGRVKVADFGLVRLTGEQPSAPMLTRAGETVGTPHYMAPEQLERPLEVDHRADIYALGVVFYELLTGSLPRGNFEVPSRRVHVDVRVDEIVLKSLEHEPERRYQHALDMKGDVQAAGEPASAPARAAPLAAAASTDTTEPARMMSWPRGVLGWTATFAVLWTLCALAFNAGPVWLAIAVFVLAAAFDNAVQSLAGVGPRVASKHGKFGGIYMHFGRSRGETSSHAGRLGGFVLILAGFVALGLGAIGVWESWSPGYVPPSDVRMAGLADSVLDTFFGVQASELARSPIGEDVSMSERLFHQPWLVVLGALLLALAGAWTLRALRAPRERIVSKAVLASACCLAPLVLYHAPMGLGDRTPKNVLNVSTVEGKLRERVEDVMATLPGELADAHYATTMRVYLFADERIPGGPSSGAALLLATAAPSSPLERWQLSFSGPVRERPMLLFTTSRVVDATRQWRLEVFAGHSADPARQAEWEAWLRKLVARVES